MRKVGRERVLSKGHKSELKTQRTPGVEFSCCHNLFKLADTSDKAKVSILTQDPAVCPVKDLS